VIAGHKRPGNDDDPRIIEETRQYIRDFDRLAQTTTARELYDQMLSLYPDRSTRCPLVISACTQAGGRKDGLKVCCRPLDESAPLDLAPL